MGVCLAERALKRTKNERSLVASAKANSRQCAIPDGRDGLHPLDDERRGHIHGDHPRHKDGLTWEAMRRLPLLRMASSESTLSRASREEMQLVEEIAAECKLLGAQLRRSIDAWLQPAIVAATGAGSTGAGSTGAGITEPPAQTAAMITAAPLAPTGRRGV